MYAFNSFCANSVSSVWAEMGTSSAKCFVEYSYVWESQLRIGKTFGKRLLNPALLQLGLYMAQKMFCFLELCRFDYSSNLPSTKLQIGLPKTSGIRFFSYPSSEPIFSEGKNARFEFRVDAGSVTNTSKCRETSFFPHKCFM